ncbi:MAG: hypothetical protein CSB06_00345 [Bacteroidia bacterium]|nr:MAG: hypothetical protein CSB06_00345 [Bacteroidia bacterium]
MKFTPVIFSCPQKKEGEIEFVKLLFDNGLSYFHLRRPYADKEEMISFLEQFPSEQLSKIVLHSHHALAERFHTKIHLTERDKNKADEYTRIHSIAMHNLDEIKTSSLRARYFFLSPVFDSYSKPNLKSGFSRQILSDFFAQYSANVPVFALGGIDASKIQTLKEIGFQGAGMIGYIWNAFFRQGKAKALSNFLTLQKICNQ